MGPRFSEPFRAKSVPPMRDGAAYRSPQEYRAFRRALSSRDPEELDALALEYKDSRLVKVAVAKNGSVSDDTLFRLATDEDLNVVVPAIEAFKVRGLKTMLRSSNDDFSDRELLVVAIAGRLSQIELAVVNKNASEKTVASAVYSALGSGEQLTLKLGVLFEAVRSGKTSVEMDQRILEFLDRAPEMKEFTSLAKRNAKKVLDALMEKYGFPSDLEASLTGLLR